MLFPPCKCGMQRSRFLLIPDNPKDHLLFASPESGNGERAKHMGSSGRNPTATHQTSSWACRPLAFRQAKKEKEAKKAMRLPAVSLFVVGFSGRMGLLAVDFISSMCFPWRTWAAKHAIPVWCLLFICDFFFFFFWSEANPNSQLGSVFFSALGPLDCIQSPERTPVGWLMLGSF